jgi:SAM-dependent methyltransferase
MIAQSRVRKAWWMSARISQRIRGRRNQRRSAKAASTTQRSLVLHYLEDWGPALAELRRILKPGGRLIASVDHPFAIPLPSPSYTARPVARQGPADQ